MLTARFNTVDTTSSTTVSSSKISANGINNNNNSNNNSQLLPAYKMPGGGSGSSGGEHRGRRASNLKIDTKNIKNFERYIQSQINADLLVGFTHSN